MNDMQAYMDTPIKKLRQVKRRRFWLVLRRGIILPVVLLFIAGLAATIALIPFVPVYGSSMEPTLTDGELYIALADKEYKQGDIIAFSRDGKTLTRRIIAGPGSWVSIDENGNVTVDGQILAEPYLTEKAPGQYNITFPYQVPAEHYFVMGDDRAGAVDSRSTVLGCVRKDEIIGRLCFRIWPFTDM